MDYLELLKLELNKIKTQLLELEENFECLSFSDRKCRATEMRVLCQRKSHIQEKLLVI